MASKHTEHYGLNQWELTDSVIMSDFNEDNKKIDAALAAGVKVKAGTYTGSGTYGPEHPNTLTFDFSPKLVLIHGITQNQSGSLLDDFNLTAICGTPCCYAMQFHGDAHAEIYMIWSETGLSWYSDDSAAGQGNYSGEVYRYVAIG